MTGPEVAVRELIAERPPYDALCVALLAVLNLAESMPDGALVVAAVAEALGDRDAYALAAAAGRRPSPHRR